MNFNLKTVSFFLFIAPIASVFIPTYVSAQLIVPSTDGTGTQVIEQGERFDITGGQLSGDGANLFHSFSQFGLDAGQIANFLSTPDIVNILGRVNGGDPSVINGLLQMTGGSSNLFLMNPSGILFGANASLNLPASFTATTAAGIGFDNGWFSALEQTDYGSLVGSPNAFAFDASQVGSLVNSGDLAVGPGQNLTLTAGTVINTGSLAAPSGNITIAAVPPNDTSNSTLMRISQKGSLLSVDLQPSDLSLLSSNFTVPTLSQLLTGGAQPSNATNLTVNAAGEVVLAGAVEIPSQAGVNVVSGDITVSGETGGSVVVLGERVALVGTEIEASGTGGGGQVLIGGDYQGKGSVFNAERTYISADSVIDARSWVSGNGGRVIAWADEITQFYGDISVQGGVLSGDGGFVEVSGAESLTFNGSVLLNAVNGDAGLLLLDPRQIIIVAGDGTLMPDGTPRTETLRNDLLSGGGIFSTEEPDLDTAYITEDALESLSGSVTLSAKDSIRIESLTDNVLQFQANQTGQTITLRSDLDFGIPGDPQNDFVVEQRSFSDFDPRIIRTRGGNIEFLNFEGVSGTLLSPNLEFETEGGDFTGFVGSAFIDSITTCILVSGACSSSQVGGDISLTSPINGNIELDILRSGGGNISLESFSDSSFADNGISGAVTGFADSSFNGAAGAGDIVFRANRVSAVGGSRFNASSQAGPAGDITLEIIGVDSRAAGLGEIVATGNGGGNVNIIADEIDFTVPNPTQPLTTRFDINGTLRLQPLSGDTPIIIGEDDPNRLNTPNALDLNRFELEVLTFVDPTTGIANRADGGIVIGIAPGRLNSSGNPVIATGDITLVKPVPFSSAVTIDAGTGTTLFGPSSQIRTEYRVTGPAEGFITGFANPAAGVPDLRFTNVGSIVAGNGDDALILATNDSVLPTGFLFDGGGGSNFIDFRGYTDPLKIDLGLTSGVAVATRVGGIEQIVLDQLPLNINSIVGGQGDDEIFGNANNNTLGGGLGDDFIDGRGGIDTVEVSRDSDFVLNDNALLIGATEIDTLVSIESATLNGFAESSNGNVSGNNTFTLNGWSGNANLNGATGNDNYVISLTGATTGTININDCVFADGICLATQTDDDTLQILGTSGTDAFTLNPLQVTLATQVVRYGGAELDSNGRSLSVVPSIESLTLDGEDGSDTYTARLGVADPIETSIDDTGATGEDTLRVIGTDFIDILSISNSQVTRSALQDETIGYAGFENLEIDTGINSDRATVTSEIDVSGRFAINLGINGNDINLTEDITAGSISLSTGTGNINATDIALDASSGEGAGGAVALNATEGAITVGNINATGASDGGAVSISAANGITASEIDSSGVDGNGGDVTVINSNNGSILLAFINAQGGSEGTGGDVEITSNGLIQITDSFLDQNDVDASISTAGGLTGGAIDITFRDRLVPFTIGDATENGTAGAITSGDNNSILSLVSVADELIAGNISIVNLAFVEPPVVEQPVVLPGVEVSPVDPRVIEISYEEPLLNLAAPICSVPVTLDTDELDLAGVVNRADDDIDSLCETLGVTEQDR